MDNPEIFKFFPEPVFKFQFENFRNFNPELSEYIYKLSKKDNKGVDFDNFEKCFDKLKILSLDGSMKLIKDDLKKLGITHDNFFSESQLIKKDLVNETVKKLKVKKLYKNRNFDCSR